MIFGLDGILEFDGILGFDGILEFDDILQPDGALQLGVLLLDQSVDSETWIPRP